MKPAARPWQNRGRGAGAAALVGALALGALAGCGVRGLAFREDTRVDIVEPADREVVALPVTVRWTVRDFGGSFAVVVDGAPQPPGEPLGWFARDDDSCRARVGCPDEEYLANRRVFVTAEPELTVERLPDTEIEGRRREFHEVTVVLLDGEGRRVGESAWSVEFQVER